MGLSSLSLLKLGIGIGDAISIIVFFFIARGYDPFWLSAILILSVLLVIAVLGSWIASKRVETELTR